MMETRHPLGRRGDQRLQLPGGGVAWNAALALVCGDSAVWKPSENAADRAGHAGRVRACRETYRDAGQAPDGLSGRAARARGRWRHAGDRQPRRAGLGHRLHPHGPRRGRSVAKRFARCLLNWAATTPPSSRPRRPGNGRTRVIVSAPSAPAGQRCTTTPPAGAHQRVRRWCRDCRRSTASCASATAATKGAGRPLIDAAAFNAMQPGWPRARCGRPGDGGERVMQSLPQTPMVRSPAWLRCRRSPTPCAAKPSRPSSTSSNTKAMFDEAIALQQRGAARPVVGIFTNDLREMGVFSARPAATAASPTSTSAPAAPRSAARSFGEKKPAAAANRLRTLEGLHAPRHQHHQLRRQTAAGAGHSLRPVAAANAGAAPAATA